MGSAGKARTVRKRKTGEAQFKKIDVREGGTSNREKTGTIKEAKYTGPHRKWRQWGGQKARDGWRCETERRHNQQRERSSGAVTVRRQSRTGDAKLINSNKKANRKADQREEVKGAQRSVVEPRAGLDQGQREDRKIEKAKRNRGKKGKTRSRKQTPREPEALQV